MSSAAAGSAGIQLLKPAAGESGTQPNFAPIEQHPKQPSNKSRATRGRGIGKGDARRICKAYTWGNRKGEGGCAAKRSRFLPSLGFPLAFAPLRPAKFTVEAMIQNNQTPATASYKKPPLEYAPDSHRRRKGDALCRRASPSCRKAAIHPLAERFLCGGVSPPTGGDLGLCPKNPQAFEKA